MKKPIDAIAEPYEFCQELTDGTMLSTYACHCIDSKGTKATKFYNKTTKRWVKNLKSAVYRDNKRKRVTDASKLFEELKIAAKKDLTPIKKPVAFLTPIKPGEWTYKKPLLRHKNPINYPASPQLDELSLEEVEDFEEATYASDTDESSEDSFQAPSPMRIDEVGEAYEPTFIATMAQKRPRQFLQLPPVKPAGKRLADFPHFKPRSPKRIKLTPPSTPELDLLDLVELIRQEEDLVPEKAEFDDLDW
jgi:hypothetical protein